MTRVHNLATALQRSMEAHWLLFLTLFSVCYWTATGLYAAWRVMWYDELFTFYLSNLPSPVAIWNALAAGADLHPPAHYWFSHWSQAVLGAGELGLRAPAIAGFWVLSLCVFFFVKRRTDALHAGVAMLLLFATGTQLSRLDARPYPLVLACAALALLCWQLSAEGRHRSIALPGLALSLFVAIMSHYYAVFLVPAIALGELVRTRRRGRVDRSVWFMLAVGASAVLFLLPIIASSGTFAEHFARSLPWGDLVQVYVELLGGTVPLLLVGLALIALSGAGRSSGAEGEVNLGPVLPFEEIAACLGLLAMPIPAFLLARFVTEAWAARYVGAVVIGFCILVAAALYGHLRRSHGNAVAAGLFVVLAGWFPVAAGVAGSSEPGSLLCRRSTRRTRRFLAASRSAHRHAARLAVPAARSLLAQGGEPPVCTPSPIARRRFSIAALRWEDTRSRASLSGFRLTWWRTLRSSRRTTTSSFSGASGGCYPSFSKTALVSS